jgi:AraC-like DNA-binding protein
MPPPDHPSLYRPPAGHPLQPYVQSIFRVCGELPFRQETLLPRGTVDLVFNLGETVRATGLVPEAYVAHEGDAWVSGLKTRPYTVLPPRSGMHLIGVNLCAETCGGLLPVPPAEIINREAHDPPGAARLRLLAEQLHDTERFAEQCALLMRWLATVLRPVRGADAARDACALLRRTPAQNAARATAKALAVSPRHLRRIMGEHVGIGPAEYVRLTRFVDSMYRMEAPGQTLTRVALAAGYFDQAHFCRDFRSFAGMTPQEYRGRANGVVVGQIIAE